MQRFRHSREGAAIVMLLGKASGRWPLWLELTVVITVKVLLIFCLWKLFFSTPVAKHMEVPAPLVDQQFIGVGQPSAPTNALSVSPISSLPASLPAASKSPGQTAPLSSCGDIHAC